jgi:rod shape-determining protein MreD
MGDSRPGRKLEERLFHEVLVMVALVMVAIVQTALLPTPLGFPLPLLLVLVVCRALVGVESPDPEAGVLAAVRWAFYGGIALDVCAAAPLGSHALALLLAVLLVVVLAGSLRIGRALLPLLAVLLGAVVYEMLLALIYHSTVAALDWRSHALVILLPSVLLALIPTLPIFHVLRWQQRRRVEQ